MILGLLLSSTQSLKVPGVADVNELRPTKKVLIWTLLVKGYSLSALTLEHSRFHQSLAVRALLVVSVPLV